MTSKQHYSVSDQYIVNERPYEIRASIYGGEIRLQGAFHKPGDSSRYNVQEFRTFGLITEEMGKLTEFVNSLPVNIHMPMNALIVHICTVYNFLKLGDTSKQPSL